MVNAQYLQFIASGVTSDNLKDGYPWHDYISPRSAGEVVGTPRMLWCLIYTVHVSNACQWYR